METMPEFGLPHGSRDLPRARAFGPRRRGALTMDPAERPITTTGDDNQSAVMGSNSVADGGSEIWMSWHV